MMPDSYAFEGWGNWPKWAVYLELSCDGAAWAQWVSVARRVREEFGVGAPEHRPSRVGMRPCGLAARGRLALG